MKKIHPTAIVSSSAQLADDVEIGAYACIGDAVELGARSVVQAHAVLDGLVRLGADNFVGFGAIIGAAPQDLSFKTGTRSGVEIGRANVIREQVTIHRGVTPDSLTTIGDENFLMAGAHIGHNCAIGHKTIIANNCLLGGHVTLEDGVFLGGGCVFHQFTRIGRLAITQGLSGFGKDLPPYVIGAGVNKVAGLNVVGLKRAGYGPDERAEIKAAFHLLYESGRNVSQALEEALTRNWSAPARAFFDFVAAAKRRGICGRRRKTDEAA